MPFLNSVIPSPSERMTEGIRLPNNSNTTSPKIIIVVGVINANIVLIATLKEEHQRSY